jgi:type I restriction enzyme M protein
MDLIEKGLSEGLIKFNDDRTVITYLHQDKTRKYANPEEQVQAETFLKLVLIYNYPVEHIQQFVSVKMGVTSKEADIIVYDDDKLTKPYIIIECKEPEVSEAAFDQAVEQAFSYGYATPKDLKFIWVTSNLKDNYYEFNKDSDERKETPDIPIYGTLKLEKYKYAKGGKKQNQVDDDGIKYTAQQFFELETVTEEELTRRFKQAHQALWGGGELDPSEAFDELDKLIFCKIWDEKYTLNEAQEEFVPRKKGEPYQFQIFKEETEEKTIQKLYERVTSIYKVGKKKDSEVFKDDIRLSPQRVRTVVSYLESINLSETDLDSKGRAFEAFMGSYFRGDFGQFFTPRNIVKFIVDVLPINNNARVLDTSCGSGGFLLYALDKVRSQANTYWPNHDKKPKAKLEHYNYWHDFAEHNLFGIELNEKIARTAKMNMIIHDDGHTNVISEDGLEPSEEIRNKSGNKEFKEGSFDFILTNPPFGSKIKQTEKAYMNQYNMAINASDWLDHRRSKDKTRASQSTEVMFIEQCYKFLYPGGYLAIVVPDGILTNSSMQYVRDQIEEWYRIVAVVSMPQDAFAHTGAGVKSSVMFLKKWPVNKSESIQNKKLTIQEQIKTDANFEQRVAELDDEKKRKAREMDGFDNTTGKTEKKVIKKTQAYKAWKKEMYSEYNDRINDLKEELADRYLKQKQQQLDDYPIFMAIAEKIGYDATGKEVSINELNVISEELRNFISEIEK